MRYVIAVVLFAAFQVEAASFWPVDESRVIGATVNLRDKEGGSTAVSGRAIAALINAKARLQATANIYPVLLITDQPGVNAFAGPTPKGPIVAVTTDMLRAVGEDSNRWAALLGHELGHLYHNHSAQQQGADAALNLFATLFNVYAQSHRRATYAAPLVSLGATAISRAYSREHEREADSTGLRLAVDAGFDPEGAVALHRTLLAYGGGQGGFLATHPSSEERIGNLAVEIRTKYPDAKARAISAPLDPATAIAEGKRWHTVCATEAKAKGLVGAPSNQYTFACVDKKVPVYARTFVFCMSAAKDKSLTGADANSFVRNCLAPESVTTSAPGHHWLNYCVQKAVVAGPNGSAVRNDTGRACLTSASPELLQAFEECAPVAKEADASERASKMSECMREKVPG